MKLKIAILSVALVGALGLTMQFAGTRAVADEGASMAAGALAMMPVAGTEFQYVSSKKCKMCHSKNYKSWAKTKHAKAFETLKPGQAAEAKTKHGLDATKDYTKDASCLACHTVGYGHKGGYAIPDAADEKAVKKMSKLEGVGCENCHGPGKAYIKVKKVIKKEKRKYKFEELAVVGMTKIEASTCTTCHNDKSPTYDAAKGFDFEKMKANPEAIHAHKPLKLREG